MDVLAETINLFADLVIWEIWYDLIADKWFGF